MPLMFAGKHKPNITGNLQKYNLISLKIISLTE